MLIALVIDAGLGWPGAVYNRFGHPVTWIGALIAWLDQRLNCEDLSDAARRVRGVVIALAVIGLTIGASGACVTLLPDGWLGILLAAILAWPLLAARSMHDHVVAVAQPLLTGDLPAARQAVAMIVGRDTSQLDVAGVSRAAAESLAENTSDAVVAPLLWGVIFGLPGIAAYKAINTLDSMIGHRTARYRAFGWAAARIDDMANLIPARLTGLLFVAVSARRRLALATMLRDARHHRSPNAGWPEAALAGALNIRLSGPRLYSGVFTQEPWLNATAPDPAAVDLNRALAVYRKAMLVLTLGLALLALL